jgi:ectoine hydroxylase
MNIVTPETPLADILAPLARDGYVVMHNALSPSQLAELNAAYDRQLELHPPKPGALRVEVPRILERDPVFESLMDTPPPFGVARAVLGSDIELASGGELDHKLPKTPAYIGWHSDFQWMTDVPCPRQNYWVRCTYFLSEVRADTGPFTLLPGSHLRSEPCPDNPRGPDGEPAYFEGQIGITGPAGACLINNTEIWHTNSPNLGDLPRRLIMLLYKHAWMKQWQEGYETTPEFAARQTDPLRRQLTGGITWHQNVSAFPAHKLQ